MNQIRKIRTIIFGVILFSLFSCSVVANDNLNPDTIIAVVNDIPVKHRDIQVHKDTIKFNPELSQLKNEDLQVELLKMEEQRLLFQIEKIIINKAINKFNITVSEKEIDKEFDSRVEMLNLSEQDVENIRNITTRIIEALELWQRNPAQEKKIYEKKLSNLITYQEWEMFKSLYAIPEKLEEAKKFIPTSLEHIKDISKEDIVKELKLKKLKDKVTVDVKVEDEEIMKYCTQEYPKTISWTIYHFFHRKRDVFEKIKKDLLNNKDIREIIEGYNLLKSNEGGYEKEDHFSGMGLFYTEELSRLSKSEMSSIVQGYLDVYWSERKMPSRLQENKDEVFYHFIQVIDIYKEEMPKFKDIKNALKNELLNNKKEKAWQEWLWNQINKADIEILVKEYKDVLRKRN